MAAVIVAAALLDVFWWVPAHTSSTGRAHRDAVAAEQIRARMPRCRAAEIRSELADLQARMAALQTELDALGLIQTARH